MREKKRGKRKKREGGGGGEAKKKKKRGGGKRQIFDRTISVHFLWTLIVDYQRRLADNPIYLFIFLFFIFS
jgi:hypothetical protein